MGWYPETRFNKPTPKEEDSDVELFGYITDGPDEYTLEELIDRADARDEETDSEIIRRTETSRRMVATKEQSPCIEMVITRKGQRPCWYPAKPGTCRCKRHAHLNLKLATGT